MELINTTIRGRETYDVDLTCSLLWECALGIAAITNARLIDTLEKPVEYWNKTRKSFSKELLNLLDVVQKKNTWKALLLLLHQKDFVHIDAFVHYLEKLSDQELRNICIPYIGLKYQDMRDSASKGDPSAIRKLMEITKNNSFFPDYIEFVSLTNTDDLKQHLIEVMQAWYHEFMEPEAEKVEKYLEQDVQSKRVMKRKMAPEAFVEWATGGVSYVPEPSVHQVLLIPQYSYRPWTIEADIEGTKVFYYPIANESIYPEDQDAPNYFLVHKHKALGDEIRLRLVKLLFKQNLSLQEMTNELGVGKTTVHHHLKILRSAKLVEVDKSLYRLKKNAVLSLAKELEHYLSRE